MRIAERVAGRVDVDAMLDELPAGTLAEWEAYRQIEPDPYEVLMETLKLGFTAVCTALGKDVEPEMFDIRPEREEAPTAATKFALTAALGPPD